ncbi:hypothetical protein Tco_1251819 [Tanacetum coccineum]
MAALRYRDEHNKVGYLQKPKGSDDYPQVLDFLSTSHIRFALTHNPTIFDSLVKQFWSTATIRSPELGPPAILATIDETPYTITEDSVRSQLQLADDGGIDDLPIAEIYSGMDNLGYVTEGKLTFYKNKFSPQWRFLVHTILHCLSTKSGSWDQFGSPLAVALICLSDGRKFNWSSYIFKGMVSNIGNAKKFLMYPRFLQTILGIETRITSQYQVLKLSSKLFANMKLNFEGQPMPLLAAMLSQAQAGEGAGVAAQAVPPPIPETIPETRPEPDQPQDHLSTPPRQQTSDPIAPVFEHGQSSDPNIASFSRAHETDDEPFTSTNVEDEPLGGSFHASPPRSPRSCLRSSGSLVRKSKHGEEGGEQDVDLDALLALANAAVIVDSNIPPGGASSSHIPTDVPTGVAPAGVSNKGKTPMVEEDITVKERTLKQMEDDRLGEEAAKRLHDEEQAQVDRQRAELNRRRQQEVLASAMYYTEADWINIMAQVEANASLSKTLLGDDVTEDNFPVRMAALIKRKKQALAEKLDYKESDDRPYDSGTTKNLLENFEEFEKIQKALANTQVQSFSRTLKRTGPELEEPSSKQQKSNEAPIPSVPDVPQPPVGSSPKSSDDKTFIKVFWYFFLRGLTMKAPILWSALAGWEVISTPLGEINALYRSDQSTKHFTTLREILHMVDRQDLFKVVMAGERSVSHGRCVETLGESWLSVGESDQSHCRQTVATQSRSLRAPSSRLVLVLYVLYLVICDFLALSTGGRSRIYDCSGLFCMYHISLSMKLHGKELRMRRLAISPKLKWLSIHHGLIALLGTKGLASPEAKWLQFNKAIKIANYMVLEGVLMKNKDVASSRDIQLICAEFSSIQVKTQADWMLLQSSYFNPQGSRLKIYLETGN